MQPTDNRRLTKQKILILDFLEVYYCLQHQWLEAHWHGILDAGKARIGCQAILDSLELHPVTKIINFNTKVTGHYPGAVDWVTTVWFPRLYNLGVQHFAWVYSPEFYTQVGTDAMIAPQKEVVVQAFYDEEEAKEWLASKSI